MESGLQQKIAHERSYGHLPAGNGISPAPRQATQIEALTRDITQAVNRLNLQNDNLQQKVEMFAGMNSAERLSPDKDPSPPDGTMAALLHQAMRLRNEVERYGTLSERLAEIF